MPILSTLSSTLASSSFVLGLGIGVASTTLVSKYLYKQVRDRAQLDIEDNESGGMDIIWQIVMSHEISPMTTRLVWSSQLLSHAISIVVESCNCVAVLFVIVRIFSRDSDSDSNQSIRMSVIKTFHQPYKISLIHQWLPTVINSHQQSSSTMSIRQQNPIHLSQESTFSSINFLFN